MIENSKMADKQNRHTLQRKLNLFMIGKPMKPREHSQFVSSISETKIHNFFQTKYLKVAFWLTAKLKLKLS